MPRGPRLEDRTELLLRQVHPSWIQAGRPTSQAFRPTPKDESLLSVSRGSLTSPEDALELHTVQKGLASAGVWSVTVEDCASADRPVHADPIEEPVPDRAHAVVDFEGLSHGKVKAVSQQLQSKAIGQYVPPR